MLTAGFCLSFAWDECYNVTMFDRNVAEIKGRFGWFLRQTTHRLYRSVRQPMKAMLFSTCVGTKLFLRATKIHIIQVKGI